MRWRDIRLEKPTSLDGDNNFEVITIDDHGNRCSMEWDEVDEEVAAWWCPASELPDPPDRIPDPPDGWRFVKTGEVFDKRAKFWHEPTKSFMDASITYYLPCNVYIVPIDPPEPQYRSYNAAELKQLIGKLVDSVAGYRAMITGACGDAVFCQGQKVSAEALLKDHTWTDGGKCGVRVDQ